MPLENPRNRDDPSVIKRARKFAGAFLVTHAIAIGGGNVVADHLVDRFVSEDEREGRKAFNRIVACCAETEVLAFAVFFLSAVRDIHRASKDPDAPDHFPVPFSLQRGKHQYVSEEQMQGADEDQAFNLTGRKMSFASDRGEA